MKHIGALLALTICLLFSTSIGVLSILGISSFSHYVEYEGELDRTITHDIILVTEKSNESINLSFAYDHDSDLVISDFTQVSVKGYYNSLKNVLMVEEIDEQSEVPNFELLQRL